MGHKISTQDLTVKFGKNEAIRNIRIDIAKNEITAIIGPSGCGKSTLLRALNRMHDMTPGAKVTGKIFLDGEDVLTNGINSVRLRKKIGMVFQKPNPFPTMSIADNVGFAPRMHGIRDRKVLDRLVEKGLKGAALWDEVKDRLDAPATGLSGGQQQRLCIARALAVEPEVILMDEPCSALDPIATAKIEDLLLELKKTYTVVIVTHNMQQAARVSDRTAFMYLGDLIEYGDTKQIFENPENEQTEQYITGRFG